MVLPNLAALVAAARFGVVAEPRQGQADAWVVLPNPDALVAVVHFGVVVAP